MAKKSYKKKASSRPKKRTDSSRRDQSAASKGADSQKTTLDPFTSLITAVQDYETDETLNAPCAAFIRDNISKDLRSLENQYNVLVLFDDNSLMRPDADKIYTAIKKFSDNKKSVLLVLYSGGGEIEPAYFISKLCRENSHEEFHVAVPRRAKSAATLVSCGADKIHMGSLSELGPIDPQIGGLPALALKNALEHLATLSRAGPHATEMFAQYLSKTLKLQQLGYFERVAESAAQYAERLLQSRRAEKMRDPKSVAQMLVYDYKDHGFVIDVAEAKRVFGDSMIADGTEEYHLADSIYGSLSTVQFVIRHFTKRSAYFIGTIDSLVHTISPKRK